MKAKPMHLEKERLMNLSAWCHQNNVELFRKVPEKQQIMSLFDINVCQCQGIHRGFYPQLWQKKLQHSQPTPAFPLPRAVEIASNYCNGSWSTIATWKIFGWRCYKIFPSRSASQSGWRTKSVRFHPALLRTTGVFSLKWTFFQGDHCKSWSQQPMHGLCPLWLFGYRPLERIWLVYIHFSYENVPNMTWPTENGCLFSKWTCHYESFHFFLAKA